MAKQSLSSGVEPFHHGQRLSFEGALCTVRYFGHLAGTKGQWLGVEWDDPSRGKHTGTHQGKSVFQCLSSSSTAASFVRQSRLPDPKRTFLEAVRFKYSGEPRLPTSNGSVPKPQAFRPPIESPIEISGKEVEEIGFDRIRQQQAALENLKIVVVDGLCIAGALNLGTSSAEYLHDIESIGQYCPNVLELDLSRNLFETLQEVADICQFLRKLRRLNLSGSRFRSLTLPILKESLSPFQKVEELLLNECLLTTDQISELITQSRTFFPSLKTLSLSSNNLASFPGLPNSADTPSCRSLTSLVFENNILKSLESLISIQKSIPSLRHLSLQGNSIKTTGILVAGTQEISSTFPNIATLDLSRNQITAYTFVDALPALFPQLQSLRISNNPLCEALINQAGTTTAKQSDALYFLTLARIPTLQALNYTTITTRDREDGEIYYLSIAEKDIAPSLQTAATDTASLTKAAETAKQRYPRYEELCRIYDRDSVIAKTLSTPPSLSTSSSNAPPVHAPGSFGARLIRTIFYTPTATHTLLLPRTIDVYRLKALLSRTFHLPTLQFKLIYESPELDPVREDINASTDWGDWGDWDVDGDENSSASSGGEPETKSAVADAGEEKWADGVLRRDGGKWRRREIEIVDGFREWGFLLEDGVGEATVRVEVLRAETW